MAKQKKTEYIEEEEEKGQDISKNLLGSLLNGYKEDHYAFVESKNKIISTGSLILDSLVKIRSGDIVRLVGKGAELGKTSECFVLSSNYMNVMPKSKTIFIKAEARLSEEIQKRSGHTFVFKAEDWNYNTTFVLPCNIFETVAQMLETLLKKMYEQGEHLCIILDSLDGLILKTDLEKNVFAGENVKVAGVPLFTKLLFKRLGLSINHYDALFLVTGQYSANIKLDPYAPNIPRQAESSGGSSISHMSSYVFEYLPRYQSDYILENPNEKPDIIKNKTLGVYATLEIKKSGTDVSGTKVKIPIRKNRVGNAIWREFEVCDMLLSFEMIKKGGAGWFTLSGDIKEELIKIDPEIPEKIQGINNIRLYLEQQPKVTNYLFEKFRNLISE